MVFLGTMTSRNYCFTLNNPPADFEDGLDPNKFKYYISQREVGESGTEHIQGYFILNSPQRITWCRNNINAHAHYERRRGSHEEAKKYCQKADTSAPRIVTGKLSIRYP